MVTIKDLLDAIMALSHNEQGGCWCGFGIGHPLCTGHSKACSRLGTHLMSGGSGLWKGVLAMVSSCRHHLLLSQERALELSGMSDDVFIQVLECASRSTYRRPANKRTFKKGQYHEMPKN